MVVTANPELSVGDVPCLVLARSSTAIERTLIDDWVREEGCGTALVEVVDASPETVAAALARRDDPLVVPVRVAWLARERNGERHPRWSDVLSLATCEARSCAPSSEWCNVNRTARAWSSGRQPH